MNTFLNIIKIIKSKQLSRNFSIYAFGRIISLALSLFLLPLFTKKLPTAEFGIIGLLWLVNPLLSRVMNLGMDVGVSIKFFKKTHQELSHTLYNGLFAITFFSIVIWLFGYLKIEWIQFLIDETMTRKIFTFLVVSCLFSSYLAMMRSFLQNAGKATLNVAMTILPNLITVVITYLFVIYISPSYKSYIIGMAVGNLLTGFFAVGFFLKKYPIKYFTFSIPVIKNLLRIGLPILPGTIANIILASGDRYMIKLFLGLEAVAIYTFGYRFSEHLSFGLFQSFEKSFSPVVYKLASKNTSEARKYNITVINRVIILFSLIIALILIPFRDIMNLIGSNEYTLSYFIFLISLVGTFVYHISGSESNLLLFIERTEITVATVLIAAGVNIGLNFIFIPKYGYIAAAFTTIISYVIMLVIRNYFLTHFFKLRNLLQLLARIIPLVIYISIIYAIDTYINNVSINYGIKSLIFILFILLLWSCFEDFRNQVKSKIFKK